MLIRKLGGADALRASLMQFEMREDGTIEREWLEGNNYHYGYTGLVRINGAICFSIIEIGISLCRYGRQILSECVG